MDNASNLIQCFIRSHASEAARVLENCSTDELVPFFARTPPELAAALFNTMETSTSVACLERMAAAQAAAALAQVPLERAAMLVRRLQPEAREAVLPLLPPDFNKHLELLLRYPEETAGALMEPRVFTLPPEISVKEALARVQANPDYALYYLYVVERDQTLAGVLNLRELLAGGEGASVAALMHRDVVCLRMGDSLASVLAHPAWLEFYTLPVLDEQALFAGALRHRTLRQLASRADLMAHPGQAGTALGELYRIGLSALVKSTLGVDRLPSPIADHADQ